MQTQALQGIPVRAFKRAANQALANVLEERAKPAEKRKRPKYYDPGSRQGKALKKLEEEEAVKAETLRKKEEEEEAVKRASEEVEDAPALTGGRRLGTAPVEPLQIVGDSSVRNGDAGPSSGAAIVKTESQEEAVNREPSASGPVAQGTKGKGKAARWGSGNRLGDPITVKEEEDIKPAKAKGKAKATKSVKVKDEVDDEFFPPTSPSAAPRTLGGPSGKDKKRAAQPAEDDAAAIRQKRLAAMEARMAVKTDVKDEVKEEP